MERVNQYLSHRILGNEWKTIVFKQTAEHDAVSQSFGVL